MRLNFEAEVSGELVFWRDEPVVAALRAGRRVVEAEEDLHEPHADAVGPASRTSREQWHHRPPEVMAETENMAHPTNSPLLEHDHVDLPVFLPKNLLEGARRQKRLAPSTLPAGCLLDMDGELVERLAATGRAILDSNWPCFHTRLYRWAVGGAEYGVVGGTVGAPFSVLVAEELFASGCEALVSISSAGLVAPDIVPPFFVLIERALRDEGTSHHYLPPERWAEADLRLIKGVSRSIPVAAGRVLRGASWTTDAPFRETEALIASRPWDSGLPVYVCRDPLGTMAELWPELRRFGTWSYATHASDERPRSGPARSD